MHAAQQARRRHLPMPLLLPRRRLGVDFFSHLMMMISLRADDVDKDGRPAEDGRLRRVMIYFRMRWMAEGLLSPIDDDDDARRRVT